MAISSTFVTGQVFTAADANLMANSGLVYVASSTIGTTVSSHVVSGCFSSTYDNYRITITGGVASTATDYNIQLNGITGSVYQTVGYYITFGTATLVAFAPALTTSMIVGSSDAVRYGVSFDLYSPNLTQQKFLTGANGISTTATYFTNSKCTSTSVATGFTIIPASPTTLTGGTVTVYGYRKV
jgi:hypothetical protein